MQITATSRRLPCAVLCWNVIPGYHVAGLSLLSNFCLKDQKGVSTSMEPSLHLLWQHPILGANGALCFNQGFLNKARSTAV